MRNFASFHDIGAFLLGKNALNPEAISITTASTERTGFNIDRDTNADEFLSAKVIIPYSASLDAGDQATLKANAQHADSTASTAWEDFDDKDGSTANSVTIGTTGSTAAQTINDALSMDLDLSAAKRYVRVQVTAQDAAPSTASNTVDVAGVLVLGGSNSNPAD